MVLRYLGELGLLLGVASLVPSLASIFLREIHLLAPYGLLTVLLLVLGFLARRAPRPNELQRSEALVITVLAFVLSPLLMSLPLVFQGVNWLDAVFEAISGVTTTGLSTLDSLEGRPRTFLVARAWMQWVGGLGFVVLSLALLLEPSAAARQLGAPGLEPAEVPGSMRAHARRVLLVYLMLSGLGWSVLVALGASGFDALVHTFAAVSTGGFAPRDSSLAELGARIQVFVLTLSLLGAISLPLYAGLAEGRWRRLRNDAQARMLLLLIAVVSASLWMVSGVGEDPDSAGIADLALLSVSSQTTAGFSTFTLDRLPDSSKAILILSMITGGSVGSTAGGIKLLRLLVMVQLLRWLVARTRLPTHAVSWPTLSGERLESDEALRAAALILLFLSVVLVSWIPFLACGHPPLEALFEVVSATGTVGLSVVAV
ncbi:MAG: TrkH family potassium uptake protein, partial [Deltaproteobacteria bacterium]|nr:TrkH family potassium uptake protein [Deltaproteobacteria bacterium]